MMYISNIGKEDILKKGISEKSEKEMDAANYELCECKGHY